MMNQLRLLGVYCCWVLFSSSSCDAFSVRSPALSITGGNSLSATATTATATATTSKATLQTTQTTASSYRNSQLYSSRSSKEPEFYDDGEEEDDDEEDEDDLIDADSLGDWRAFRRNLAAVDSNDRNTSTTTFSSTTSSTSSSSTTTTKFSSKNNKPGSRENEELLQSQNEELAREYRTGVWAHETATPELGGLVVRLPLEVELYRNHRHSLTGRRLRKKLLQKKNKQNSNKDDDSIIHPADYYDTARSMVQDEMLDIAQMAGEDGQIDAAELSEESAELLQLYLDNQETWQEVCLVLEKRKSTTTTLVLNRPMALKLTENLAQLVLYGTGRKQDQDQPQSNDKNKDQKEFQTTASADLIMVKFLLAFGQECAVYIGGPDAQHLPAEIIHGIADLPGAHEISPGTGLYRGGLSAAIDGVLRGDYRPLDFRFFFGRHVYEESTLDVSVVLGKYQPVACARSLALKQCLSLPKPLWHEVLELCGGDWKEISELEMSKRDDLTFQIIDDDDDDDSDDDDVDLDELGSLDDDDDEEFYNRK